MLNVIVTMVPASHRVGEFETTLGELLDIVRQEPGCAEVSWGRVVGEEKYMVVERYVDEAAHQTHLATDAVKQYGPIIGELSARAPTSILFEDL
jgi:quinol monooxygenase YgiN